MEYLALARGRAGFTPDFTSRALLGRSHKRAVPFAYGAITRCGRTFQILRLEAAFVTLPTLLAGPNAIPATPGRATHKGFYARPV